MQSQEPPLQKKKKTEQSQSQQLVVQFVDLEQKNLGDQVVLEKETTLPLLNQILKKLKTDEQVKEDAVVSRHSFYLGENETPFKHSIAESLKAVKNYDGEKVLKIKYKPEATFAVRPITRATATLEGHGEAILCLNFSPDGTRLASGSGDKTVRFWDLNTCTPQFTGLGHKGNVLVVAFSPDGAKLASADYQGELLLWKMEKEPTKIGLPLVGHKKWVTSLAWEPMHSNSNCNRFVSASKDQTLRIWKDSICEFVLSGHSAAVTCVSWGGQNAIYSGSQDRSVKVWSSKDGRMLRDLKSHAHWVNTLALSTEYVLRTACYDHNPKSKEVGGLSRREQAKVAKKRYEEAKGLGKHERVVSGSDDHTLYLWEPLSTKKPICRLTGHSKLINQVSFSPNGQLLVSASFDSHIKVWDGYTGRFITTLKGHISSVYRVAWSADSRLLVSASKDTTLKVWDVRSNKLLFDLPGHADQVYAVDWSPNGEKVASGSKDKRLRIWAN